MVSMVDRASKLCQRRLAAGPDATHVSRAILAALRTPKHVVHTLSADNGTEFAKPVGLGRKLRAGVYFARPYHAWERGLNEHTNGQVTSVPAKRDQLRRDHTGTPQAHPTSTQQSAPGCARVPLTERGLQTFDPKRDRLCTSSVKCQYICRSEPSRNIAATYQGWS